MSSVFTGLHASNLAAHDATTAQAANSSTQIIPPSTRTPTIQDRVDTHTATRTSTPNTNFFAMDSKVLLCAHILVSHECLRDILSRMPYADLITKYPRSKECLEDCECTNVWKLNRMAAQTRIQKSDLKAFMGFARKKTKPEPHWIIAKHYLLFAPVSYQIDAPLSTLFTKERVSQVLSGFDVGICRHTCYNDPFVVDCYQPKDVIDRDHCGSDKPCSCAATKTGWGGYECPEDGCQAGFDFCVFHMKAVQGRRLVPAEQCECLCLVTSRRFPSIETGTDPSWIGCAISPKEFEDGSPGFRRWDIHRVNCYTQNREWYNQACVESLNRRAGTNVARYCGKPGDYVAAPEMATEFVMPPEQVEGVSEVLDVSEGLPPPYSPFSNVDQRYEARLC